MRKMIRNLLVNCGIEDIYEASDALGVIRPATHSRHLRGPSAKFYDSTN
jgi:hypothetical protein